jgi:hypothetical protein
MGEFSPIGLLFTLGSFVKITDVAQIFGLLFPRLKLWVNFDKKIIWATFWTIHLQTDLVTLIGSMFSTYCIFLI